MACVIFALMIPALLNLVYREQARAALAKCDRLDECKDWADKMEALASYAKQSKDEELEKAIRRCGELLQQLDARGII